MDRGSPVRKCFGRVSGQGRDGCDGGWNGGGTADAHPPAFATFEDGYRANCIVESILASSKRGGVWTDVSY